MSSARTACRLCTVVLALAGTAPVWAEESEASPRAAATENPVLAATPAQPSDAERLQALEKQVTEQQKTIEAMQAERAEAALPEATTDLEPPKLRIYGFADMGGQWLGVAEGPYTDLITSGPAFALGNINLYFDARPSPAWRALVETRYGIAPHGSWSGRTQVDNRFMDTSSPSGRGFAIWSGVILERAWLQWTYDEKLALQVGYLLTPYGIWNVDHGTPTLISLLLPSMWVDETIPNHQLGLQALGALTHQDWSLGYHAYLTNGRNSFTSETHANPSVGGRLVLRRAGKLRLALGTSGYYGTFRKDTLWQIPGTDPVTGAATMTFEKSDLAKDGGYAGEEWAAGGDVSLDYLGLRFRGEAMVRHVGYEDGKHEHKTFGKPEAMIPNHYRHYAYAILAYRFAGFVEPYLFIDYNDSDPQVQLNKFGICYSGGLNLYFTPSAMLKMQYAEQRFSHSEQGQMDMRFAAVRLVLVF
jgi:hypothetical protein